MIYLYKGARGKGKTLTMIKDAYIDYLEGKKVYTNMKSVKFGNYISNEEILKINKESNLRKCVLLIDEIQSLFNARRSQRKENLNFSFFVQQIRKREIELLMTTQFANTIDLILRQHLDFIVTPHFDKELNVCKVDYMDLNSADEDINGGQPEIISVVYDCKDIFGLYDTQELIV